MKESFYGGRSGVSFTIVEHFDSVAAMVESFSKGGGYSAVSYGEYVLIDTIINLNNKRSLENGLIYQRGFNSNDLGIEVPKKENYDTLATYEAAMYDYFLNPGGGATYVGKIAGPIGDSPYIEIAKESEIENDDQYSGGGTADMVAGDKQSEITYAYCNLRDEAGNIVGCKLGFTIPYHVFSIQGSSISAYDTNHGTYDSAAKTWSYSNLISKLSGNDDSSPFKSSWALKIPGGVRGADFVDLRVNPQTYEYEYKTRDYSASAAGAVSGWIPTGFYLNVIKDIVYDDTPAQERYTISFTSPEAPDVEVSAKMLYEVTLDNEYRINVSYGDGRAAETKIISEPIKFLDTIALGDDNKFHFTYNTGETEIDETIIKFITEVYMAEDKSLHVKYNDNTDIKLSDPVKFIDRVYVDETDKKLYVVYNTDSTPVELSEAIKFIESIGFNTAENKLQVSYNIGDDEIIDQVIKFIDEVYIDAETQKLHVKYNTGDNVPVSQAIKFITELKLNDQKQLQVFYNTGEDAILSDPVKFVDEIFVDENQQIHVTYNTGESAVIGEPINFIAETRIKDYHLQVKYSDPSYKTEHPELVWDEDWHDIGYVRGESGGIHVLGHYNTLAELEAARPNGPANESAGWVYTAGEGEDLQIYAWDYENGGGWYSIGSLVSMTSPAAVMLVSRVSELDSNVPAEIDELNVNGYWFVVEV